jgi:deoxyribonuclease-4
MLAAMGADTREAVGAHVSSERPLAEAAELEIGCLQLFLSDPQSFRRPAEHPDATALRDSGLAVYVHAPYLINVCSPKNNIRYGSRKILQQTCDAAAKVGAAGVIVHAGHSEDGIEAGIGRWPRTLELLETEVPILIENTAGGENAVGRRVEALARLWDALGAGGASHAPGFCFDTCHAHAAGEQLSDAVERARAITGRIDLLHANDSRDAAGSGADRHANLGHGRIGPEALRAMIGTAGAPVICETPGPLEAIRADLEFARSALAGDR